MVADPGLQRHEAINDQGGGHAKLDGPDIGPQQGAEGDHKSAQDDDKTCPRVEKPAFFIRDGNVEAQEKFKQQRIDEEILCLIGGIQQQANSERRAEEDSTGDVTQIVPQQKDE